MEHTKQELEQIAMFGGTVSDMRDAVLFTDLKDPKQVNMYAMSILSDAQEAIAVGSNEVGRQYINQAKYWISEASRLMA